MQDSLKIDKESWNIDGEKKSVSEKMVEYYNASGGDTLTTFQFRPHPMNFEVIDCKTFTEVLYPRSIYDLIDYADRECVKRKVKLRISKTVDAILFHWTHQRGILQLRFRRHGPHMQGDRRHPRLDKKAECEKKIISLDKFVEWLKQS